MLSKLLLFFGTIAVTVTVYCNSITTSIAVPASAMPGSLVAITGGSGQWLCSVDHKTFGNTLVFVMPSHEVTIIYDMQQYVISCPTPPDPFTELINSWAPNQGRYVVATSLAAIANNYVPDPDAEDPVLDFIKLTRLNNKIHASGSWKIFFQNLGKYCQDNMATATLQEHRDLWLKVAEVLNDNQ